MAKCEVYQQRFKKLKDWIILLYNVKLAKEQEKEYYKDENVHRFTLSAFREERDR